MILTRTSIFIFIFISIFLASCSKEEPSYREIDLDEVVKEKAKEDPKEAKEDPEVFHDDAPPPPEVVMTFHSRIKHGAGNAEHNVKLASSKISGIILEPGGKFSFNKIVGERTAENGFKDAPILFGGVIQDGMGGGVCQVSASLYNAIMYTGLKVIERHPHSRPASYAEKGMDSAINWPHVDLKFKNNTSEKIEIKIDVNGGEIYTQFMFYTNPPVNPDFVKTFWVGGASVDFRTNYIKSKYITKEKVAQKGEVAYPGFRVWDYGEKQLRVFSTYKPVSRVIIVPDDASSNRRTHNRLK